MLVTIDKALAIDYCKQIEEWRKRPSTEGFTGGTIGQIYNLLETHLRLREDVTRERTSGGTISKA